MTFIYEPRLYILCGLPFSGKTTLAKQLVETLRIPGIDLDVINSAKGIGREGQPISADEWDDTYTRSYQQLSPPICGRAFPLCTMQRTSYARNATAFAQLLTTAASPRRSYSSMYPSKSQPHDGN